MTLKMRIMDHLKHTLVIKLLQTLVKINGRKSDVNSLTVYGGPIKIEEAFKYLGETFSSKGNNVVYCKHIVDKLEGSVNEIISFFKKTNFGKHQIFSMMVV